MNNLKYQKIYQVLLIIVSIFFLSLFVYLNKINEINVTKYKDNLKYNSIKKQILEKSVARMMLYFRLENKFVGDTLSSIFRTNKTNNIGTSILFVLNPLRDDFKSIKASIIRYNLSLKKIFVCIPSTISKYFKENGDEILDLKYFFVEDRKIYKLIPFSNNNSCAIFFINENSKILYFTLINVGDKMELIKKIKILKN